MKYALSGRFIETGGGVELNQEEFLALAAEAGYDGVDLRGTQLPADASAEDVADLKKQLSTYHLEVAVLNLRGKSGTELLDQLKMLLPIARDLGCTIIRTGGDVNTVQQAADLARSEGIRLAAQMHTNGDFESVAVAEGTLAEIGRDNFGVIIEPANLFMAGDEFSAENFGRIGKFIFLCNIQSLITLPPEQAPAKLILRDGTIVGYRRVPLRENEGMRPREFFAALKGIGFDGWINVLEPRPDTDDLLTFARDYLTYLKEIVG